MDHPLQPKNVRQLYNNSPEMFRQPKKHKFTEQQMREYERLVEENPRINPDVLARYAEQNPHDHTPDHCRQLIEELPTMAHDIGLLQIERKNDYE